MNKLFSQKRINYGTTLTDRFMATTKVASCEAEL